LPLTWQQSELACGELPFEPPGSRMVSTAASNVDLIVSSSAGGQGNDAVMSSRIRISSAAGISSRTIVLSTIGRSQPYRPSGSVDVLRTGSPAEVALRSAAAAPVYAQRHAATG
jgi:hypothetical protein